MYLRCIKDFDDDIKVGWEKTVYNNDIVDIGKLSVLVLNESLWVNKLLPYDINEFFILEYIHREYDKFYSLTFNHMTKLGRDYTKKEFFRAMMVIVCNYLHRYNDNERTAIIDYIDGRYGCFKAPNTTGYILFANADIAYECINIMGEKALDYIYK